MCFDFQQKLEYLILTRGLEQVCREQDLEHEAVLELLVREGLVTLEVYDWPEGDKDD